MREEITGDHLLHNTLGTCASGPQTGADPSGPPTRCCSAPRPTPAPRRKQPAALRLRQRLAIWSRRPTPTRACRSCRDDTSGCNYEPDRHRHTPSARCTAGSPIRSPTDFEMNGKVTLEFYTRTLNDALYHGTLCVYLFDRHETGSAEEPPRRLAADKQRRRRRLLGLHAGGKRILAAKLLDQGAADDGIRRCPGNDPGGRPARRRAQRRPRQHRSGAIPIMYDHPNYPTRIEVDTTTPIDGEGASGWPPPRRSPSSGG